MPDTRLLCPKCNEPMVYVETIKATKDGKTREVKVYTCFKDKEFTHIP